MSFSVPFTAHEPCNIPKSYRVLASKSVERETLSSSIEADALVVGAGITGNTLAIHLAEAGKSVVQLEAKVPGWGGSGRAFGSVVPCHKNTEPAIIRHYGEQRGTRVIDAIAQGPALVADLLKRHNIDAAFDSGGWAFGAHTKAFEKTLQKRAEYWQSRGADVEYLDAQKFSRLIGSDYYQAGIVDRRALSINPLAYARGLFEAAHEIGVSQYTNSPAVRLKQKESGNWQVATPHGKVECQNIYICTNAYTKGIWPGLEKGFVPVRGWGATTTTIDSEVLADILPENHFITDTRQLWSGIRKLPSDQMHLGIGGPAVRTNGKADLKTASKRLKEVYPSLKSIEWKESWSGWIAVSTDQFPRILRLANGVWAAHGYSGRGLAMATLLGKELSFCNVESDLENLILPVEKLSRIPFHKLSPFGAAMLLRWYAFTDYLGVQNR
ncbi:MAG: FAD-binding oxidoreductase [Gammaproteobacteria bacterium]|nr:FAD-binding oxidoreductase [Gammaproteobacteria bacterium]